MKTGKKTSAAPDPILLSSNRSQCAVVLGHIYYEGPRSSRQICEGLGLSQTSVSDTLQTLVTGEIVRPTKDVPKRYAIRDKISLSQALKELSSLFNGETSNEPKQKLTLAIRKDVIERAKDHGINISAATEEFLRAITYEYFENSNRGIYETYLALFEAIKPVVDLYSLEIEVGSSPSTDDSGQVTLEPLFISHSIELPRLRTTMRKNLRTMWAISSFGVELNYLYDPIRVLENLIEAVIKKSQNDKLKLQQLKMSLRLAKAILSTED